MLDGAEISLMLKQLVIAAVNTKCDPKKREEATCLFEEMEVGIEKYCFEQKVWLIYQGQQDN